MQLSHLQKSALARDGFVQVPGVVPRVMVDAAVKAINHDIGQGMDTAMVPTYQVQTFCPKLTGTPVITGLVMRTPALSLLESALGTVAPITGGQIALRFPVLSDPPRLGGPHIDGLPDKALTNGVPAGTMMNFAALACVLLSDLPAPMSGNFTVWPGTHRSNASWLRRDGFRSLFTGMPQHDLPPAHQVVGQAGDLIIAHYLLGHSVAPNVSPNVRYACFFRINPMTDDARREAAVTDEWLDWPGMAGAKKG